MQYGLKWIVVAFAFAIAGWAALLPAQAQSRRPSSPPAPAEAPARPPLATPSKFASGTNWVNEDGSVLAITTVTPSGLINGTFTTQLGCGAGKPQPVTGWFYTAANGGAVSFSVYWNGCNSVTSYSGQFNNTTGQFQALWYLTMASVPIWNGIVAGADIFVPEPKTKP